MAQVSLDISEYEALKDKIKLLEGDKEVLIRNEVAKVKDELENEYNSRILELSQSLDTQRNISESRQSQYDELRTKYNKVFDSYRISVERIEAADNKIYSLNAEIKNLNSAVNGAADHYADIDRSYAIEIQKTKHDLYAVQEMLCRKNIESNNFEREVLALRNRYKKSQKDLEFYLDFFDKCKSIIKIFGITIWSKTLKPRDEALS